MWDAYAAAGLDSVNYDGVLRLNDDLGSARGTPTHPFMPRVPYTLSTACVEQPYSRKTHSSMVLGCWSAGTLGSGSMLR